MNFQFTGKTMKGYIILGILLTICVALAGCTTQGQDFLIIETTPSDGNISAVTGTAPIASSGGTTPDISLIPCPTGQYYQYLAGAWTCVNDQNAAGGGGSSSYYTAGGNIVIDSADENKIHFNDDNFLSADHTATGTWTFTLNSGEQIILNSITPTANIPLVDINIFDTGTTWDADTGRAINIEGVGASGKTFYPFVIDVNGYYSTIGYVATVHELGGGYAGGFEGNVHLDTEGGTGVAIWGYLKDNIGSSDAEVAYLWIEKDAAGGDVGGLYVEEYGGTHPADYGIKISGYTQGFVKGILFTGDFLEAGIDMADNNILNASDIHTYDFNVGSGIIRINNLLYDINADLNFSIINQCAGDDNSVLAMTPDGVVCQDISDFDVGGGGGGATVLDELADVSGVDYTAGYVLRADGSGYVSAELDHNDLDETGTYSHNQIDDHVDDSTNPHTVTTTQIGAVDITTAQSIGGEKTFTTIPILPASSPTQDDHAVRKKYADDIVTGLTWKEPVIDKNLSAPPGSPVAGDRYIVMAVGTGAWAGHDWNIMDYNGDTWISDGELVDGWAVFTTYDSKGWIWSSADGNWIQFSGGTAYSAGDGLDLTGTTFSVDIKAGDGLKILSTELTAAYDNTSIGITDQNLTVQSGGITNDMLAGAITPAKLDLIDTANKVDWNALNMANSSLDDLNDVSAPSPSDDQCLAWDAVSSLWIPQTVSGAGSSTAQTTIIDIDVLSDSKAAQRWTNMLEAMTELFGNSQGRVKVDLAQASQYRIVVYQSVAGYAGADLDLNYSTNGSTWIMASETAGAGELDIGTGTGVKVGNWAALAAGAQTDVWIRFIGKEGDGKVDPSFTRIAVQFKVPGGDAITDTNADTACSGASTFLSGEAGCIDTNEFYAEITQNETITGSWTFSADGNYSIALQTAILFFGNSSIDENASDLWLKDVDGTVYTLATLALDTVGITDINGTDINPNYVTVDKNLMVDGNIVVGENVNIEGEMPPDAWLRDDMAWFYDDFLGDSIDARWTVRTGATGTVEILANQVNGVVQLHSQTNWADLSWADFESLNKSQNVTWIARLKLSSVAAHTGTTTTGMRVFGGGTTNSARFLFDPDVNANWVAQNYSGGLLTATTTTAAASTSHQTLKIVFTPTSCKFYVDEVEVASHSTNLTTSNLEPFFAVVYGNLQIAADVDYFKVWQER